MQRSSGGTTTASPQSRLGTLTRARARASLLGSEAVVVLPELLCELRRHGVVLADAPGYRVRVRVRVGVMVWDRLTASVRV